MPPSMPPARAVVLVDPPVAHDDLVVRLRTRPGRRREPVADLDALHRLDAHQREREPAVELAVVVHVGAEARRARRRRAPRRRRRRCRAPSAGGRSRRPSPSTPPASKHRTGERVDDLDIAGPGTGAARAGTFTDPIRTTWETQHRRRARRGTTGRTSPPSCARRSRGRSLARARCGRRRTRTSASRRGRRGPGRGRVSFCAGLDLARDAHQRRRTSRRTPGSGSSPRSASRACGRAERRARISNRSDSNRWRPPRPWPWRRRAS